MDESVYDAIINALIAVNNPQSSITARNEATLYIEAFKLRDDGLSYLSSILVKPSTHYPSQYVQIIKYFSLIVIENVS